MALAMNLSSSFSSLDQLTNINSVSPDGPTKIFDDYKSQAETQLLNSQAPIEYGLLKARLIGGIIEANKFFELDDQIAIQEYKFCTSLSFHKRTFVMEFRQVASETKECNHTLDLLFKDIVNPQYSGHFTLILTRENKHFTWRQFNSLTHGQLGTSKSLVSLILRWVQNDNCTDLLNCRSLIVS